MRSSPLRPDSEKSPHSLKAHAGPVPRAKPKLPSVSRGQVTVLLTTDATIRDLNRRFRGKDEATDVLSFSATNPLQSQEKIAGDLAISVETARKQAAEQGHALGVELRVLILHGLLHLAGYDHETDAGKMQRRERQLRAKLGLPQGLIERTRPERTGPKRTKTRRRKP